MKKNSEREGGREGGRDREREEEKTKSTCTCIYPPLFLVE